MLLSASGLEIHFSYWGGEIEKMEKFPDLLGGRNDTLAPPWPILGGQAQVQFPTSANVTTGLTDRRPINRWSPSRPRLW